MNITSSDAAPLVVRHCRFTDREIVIHIWSEKRRYRYCPIDLEMAKEAEYHPNVNRCVYEFETLKGQNGHV
jgi:hypothetical protein